MIVALFDCDGTLFSNQQGIGMVQYAETHGRPGIKNAYYRRLFPAFLLSRLRLMRSIRFLQTLVDQLGWVMKGMSKEEGDALFRWVANDHLLATQRADTVARLAEHQAKGHTVVLISAMFMPCLQHIADHFKVKDFIGTGIEIRDGHYTGVVIPPVVTGPVKAEQARHFFSSREMDVDWPASYAYGDSYTDHNMLEIVGHPVAVYPDSKLNRLALDRNWEVLGTAK